MDKIYYGTWYRTRDGGEVKIVSTSGLEEYPVVGLLNGESLRWTKNGHYDKCVKCHPLDLMRRMYDKQNP